MKRIDAVKELCDEIARAFKIIPGEVEKPFFELPELICPFCEKEDAKFEFNVNWMPISRDYSKHERECPILKWDRVVVYLEAKRLSEGLLYYLKIFIELENCPFPAKLLIPIALHKDWLQIIKRQLETTG